MDKEYFMQTKARATGILLECLEYQYEKNTKTPVPYEDIFELAQLKAQFKNGERRGFYILNGRDTFPYINPQEEWMQKLTELNPIAATYVGSTRIETYFTGRDMRLLPRPLLLPLLFITEVWEDILDDRIWHSSTYEEAETMHWQVVEKVRVAQELISK